jgi:hypothetical protein
VVIISPFATFSFFCVKKEGRSLAMRLFFALIKEKIDEN